MLRVSYQKFSQSLFFKVQSKGALRAQLKQVQVVHILSRCAFALIKLVCLLC